MNIVHPKDLRQSPRTFRPMWRTVRPRVGHPPLALRYLEVLFFWSPFIPFLSLAILIAVCANVLVLDIGLVTFKPSRNSACVRGKSV